MRVGLAIQLAGLRTRVTRDADDVSARGEVFNRMLR
eukprot:gene11960-5099_t